MKLSFRKKSERVKVEALRLGFSSCKVTEPKISQRAQEDYKTFLCKNYHGDMNWLSERTELRLDPKALWKNVKSIIVLAESYLDTNNVLENLQEREKGNISIYARGDDYHKVVKKRLKQLAHFLVSEFSCEVKIFVDTAPILEKVLANQAGMGWKGKHTNLLSKDLGNWFFIGTIFTDLELAYDNEEKNRCGSCTSCLSSCPTDAFIEPYRLDASKCISYLTIEHKGPIDINLRPKLGNRIYGCDDCLAVCPWNKFASRTAEIRYQAREGFSAPNLSELVLLDETSFRAKFSGSPIKRIGRDRFIRNVLYAIGNSKEQGFLPILDIILDKESEDSVVYDAASWAKRVLLNHG